MKQMSKKLVLSSLMLFSSTYALTPELQTVTRALQSLKDKLETAAPELETSITPLVQLDLPKDRMISSLTAPILTNNPPYVLESGNEILQIEVLSHFLTLGAFTKKEYTLARQKMYFPLLNSDKTEAGQTTFIEKYVDRLLNVPSNKTTQQVTQANINKSPQPEVSDSIIGGGASSSGYHALKNAINIMQTHSNNTLDVNYAEELLGIPETNQFTLGKQNYGEWRQLIINLRDPQKNKLDETGEWLNKEDIEYILKNKIKNLSNFSVFDSPVFELETRQITERISLNIPKAEDLQREIKNREAFIKNKFNKSQRNYIHAFILGSETKQFEEEKSQKEYAALVVNISNSNIIQYIILDSSNIPHYQTDAHSYANEPAYKDTQSESKGKLTRHINEVIRLIEEARKR